MHLLLQLRPANTAWLPFSYYHQLSAAFYAALDGVHPDFAKDLHDGPEHHSRIKLFGFTPLHSRQMEVRKGGAASHRQFGRDENAGESQNVKEQPGLLFKGRTECLLFSPWPELMNAMSEGLLTSRELRVGSVKFRIEHTTVQPPPEFSEDMLWQPAGKQVSFVTTWTPQSGPDKGKKLAIFPENAAVESNHAQAPKLPTAAERLRDNLIHKWQRLTDATGRPDIAARWAGVNEAEAKTWITEVGDQIRVTIAASGSDGDGEAVKTKLHQIKNAPVRSWAAPVRIEAPVAVQRLVWSCGFGEMNSMGFGGVGGKLTR